MSILSLYGVTLDVAGNSILDAVDWHIQPQDRIVLVGRNGAGKSSLLKLLQDILHPDQGQIQKQTGLTIAGLTQEVPISDTHEKVYNYLVRGLGEKGEVLSRLYNLQNENNLEDLALLHQEIDRLQAWDLSSKVEAMASHLGIDPAASMQDLSGGMKRRVLLAAALLVQPDLLLLDEPTNHLDLQAIEWLENLLKNWKGSMIVVTHDRAFASQIANRIVQIDRGKLYSYDCDFDTWLERRDALYENELKHQALFDKKLAEEEAWIRTGIKARRTRNEGRVKALEALRKEYKERRKQLGKMQTINLDDSQVSGMKVLEAKNMSYQIAGKRIIQDCSLLITKGDKLGIIGPNGCGKTTLIRLLLGDLQPDSGTIQQGTNLSIAWFDQLRTQLDDTLTLMQAVGEGSDFVSIQGKQQHVASYLKDFLFLPQQFNQAVSTLSGGERNRLMLAKLLAKPVNLLVMDEPTNDLDIETLELLESVLVDYKGTLILISHDRKFIDSVVTSVLVYEQAGIFKEYVGGYKDYKNQKVKASPAISKPEEMVKTKPQTTLDYKERRELQDLPKKIEALEAKIQAMHAAMAEEGFYQQDPQKIAQLHQDLSNSEKKLSELYARWSELEEKK